MPELVLELVLVPELELELQGGGILRIPHFKNHLSILPMRDRRCRQMKVVSLEFAASHPYSNTISFKIS